MAIFVIGAIVSWRRLDLAASSVIWWPIVMVGAILVPSTIGVNVLELRALGRLLGISMTLREGSRLVIYATAANFLPVPGAAAVRVHALTSRGAALGAATAVNVLAAIMWLGVALVAAAAAGFGLVPAAAAPSLVIGMAATAGAVVTLLLRYRPSPAAILELATAELLTVLGHAVRLWLVLAALRQAASFRQAVVLGVNGPLAATAGIFPSGLGLAEGIGAALAGLVALAPAAGFAATAINRLVGMAATAPLAGFLARGEFRPDRQG